ncbi:MAG: hypothetical protein U9N57_15340 [Pseudomonadota bacterium]|nr:hypothetical protein [Pseudomonadota bacterium]
MKYIKREVPAQSQNPWADNLALTMKKGEKITAIGKNHAMVDVRTGEVMEQEIAMVSKKLVDREEFVKLFEGGISNIFDLPKGPKDLFRAILKVYLEQKMTPEQVYFNLDSLMDFGYERKKMTYLQSLNILVNKGFLAEVANRPGWFWVNPSMFFKGDRIRIVQDYAVAGTVSGDKLVKEQERLEHNSKQKSLELGE